MKPNAPALRALAVLALIALPGCATINAGIDPWARQAGVTAGAPVILEGKVGLVTIYADDDNRPLKVVIVQNPSFKTALGNAIRQSAAEARAGGSPTGSATYTKKMEYAPAIYLRQKQAHRLRIVRGDGREAVVVAKPHVGRGFLFVDWILVAPTFFTSIVVDWATGKWHVFDSINVDTIFENGDDAASASPAPDGVAPAGGDRAPEQGSGPTPQ